jgi:uncharacterized protein YuzB (UPF0349 family)
MEVLNMINICPNCSNVDIEKIQLLVGEDNVELGCIGQCGQEFVAIVNDELIEASSEEELLAEIKRIC